MQILGKVIINKKEVKCLILNFILISTRRIRYDSVSQSEALIVLEDGCVIQVHICKLRIYDESILSSFKV